ncbi:MAG TPA: hypothetical protein PLW02_04790 [Verrucomicrobiota bacterium]|nr:hypothetical protein [Verrucomicrobiota bacterium]
MKRNIILGAVILTASSFIAVGAAVDEVKSAIKNLADKPNYSWTTTVKSGGGQPGRFAPGPTEGKTEKGGITYLTMTRGDQKTEALVKGAKSVVKTQDGWQETAAPGAGGQPGGRGQRGAFMGRMLQNYKVPSVQAEELISKVKELKKDGDAYIGELTEDGVKQLLMPGGGRGGQNAPTPANAKGTVKFWVKDGVLVKYEFNVQGTMTFNNNDINIDRTTTVEIKDIGTTKIDVPDEAKQKLS